MGDGDDGRDARQAAADAARASYGRLVAYLAARSRDVAAAEDALGDAFRAAVQTWPRDGVPDRPEAWLLAAARNRVSDLARRHAVRDAAMPALAQLTEEAAARVGDDSFPDDRLKLMFVCAHPAIDPGVRTPLMLQVVLGLDAARIASAFLVAPAAMGQRLVRAKAKIRDAGLRFAVPGRGELDERLAGVLDAIYAAYGTGWEDAAGADPRRSGLADEALWLASLVVDLLPDAPEAHGLLALMLYCEARRDARRTAAGAYVPLSEQNTARWSMPMIARAEAALGHAARQGRLGRYQLEAAIQSAHTAGRIQGHIEWRAVVDLYDRLVDLAPTVGALVSRAAAVAEVHGPAAGLEALAELPDARVATYQPFWALRAHLLAGHGKAGEAADAYEQAIGLAEDPAVRRFLMDRKTNVAAPWTL